MSVKTALATVMMMNVLLQRNSKNIGALSLDPNNHANIVEQCFLS